MNISNGKRLNVIKKSKTGNYLSMHDQANTIVSHVKTIEWQSDQWNDKQPRRQLTLEKDSVERMIQRMCVQMKGRANHEDK